MRLTIEISWLKRNKYLGKQKKIKIKIKRQNMTWRKGVVNNGMN